MDPLMAPMEAQELGDYCRRVEEHLARANQGHLVRIVGTGFELVRQWAIAGIPFSLVCRAIDQKAERHRAGRSTRPLRIEFCEQDVRALFAEWRRAVGLMSVGGGVGDAVTSEVEEVKRPSLSRHLERVVTGLTRAAGRLETPDGLRDVLTGVLADVVAIQDAARGARGAAREGLSERLSYADRAMMAAARAAAESDVLARLQAEAAADLAPYRSRMDPAVWDRTLAVGTDRLLREHFLLPTIEP